MKNNCIAALALACGTLSISGIASAGFFTKDVPKNIIADPETAKWSVTIDRNVDQVANKLRSMATQCGGDHRRDESFNGEEMLVVTWMSADTVVYIQRLRPVQRGTEMVVYMNSNVSRQQRGWPKIVDEWFKLDASRCIPEIMRDA
jgi:hypothetical protein